MMAEVARHVRVTGRVQGVFFRAWTRDQAKAHGIKGWIRNCADGSVEAHLEGEEAAVRWLIDIIYDGPGGARVDRVEAQEAEVEGLPSFEVRN
jgi:acylphosphatase